MVKETFPKICLVISRVETLIFKMRRPVRILVCRFS